MATKVTDYKTMVKLLKGAGFYIERSGKHDKWVKGTKAIHAPNNHKGFSRMLAERLLKEAGVL
jgi:hypothetical protein